MQKRTDDKWRDDERAKRYIRDAQAGGIPLEAEQLDVMMRLVARNRQNVSSFMDIGCGHGVLASVILERYPEACGILIDFNDVMLDAARATLADCGQSLQYINSDYGDEALDKTFAAQKGKIDVIVSRLSIHHQTDERKREIYGEIFNLLRPGGVFVNIEFVAPASREAKAIFEDYIIDRTYENLLRSGTNKSKDEFARDIRERHKHDTEVIASVEAQCAWLRDIGFVDVNCFFKIFEIAVFGGWKQ